MKVVTQKPCVRGRQPVFAPKIKKQNHYHCLPSSNFSDCTGAETSISVRSSLFIYKALRNKFLQLMLMLTACSDEIHCHMGMSEETRAAFLC